MLESFPIKVQQTAMNFHGSSQGSMDIDDIVSGTSMLSIQSNQGDLDDGLEDMWREMAVALELSKDDKESVFKANERKEECAHSVILREDLGFVCQLCGIIETRIEDMMGIEWDSDDLINGGSGRQMALEIDFSKDDNEYTVEDGKGKGICEHTVIMRDDMGFVCQICGTLETRIENIVGYQWVKGHDGCYMVKPRIAMESENDIGDESVYLAAQLQALSTSNA